LVRTLFLNLPLKTLPYLRNVRTSSQAIRPKGKIRTACHFLPTVGVAPPLPTAVELAFVSNNPTSLLVFLHIVYITFISFTVFLHSAGFLVLRNMKRKHKILFTKCSFRENIK